MKTLFFVLIGLLLVSSCEESHPRFTYETIMIDRSDETDSVRSTAFTGYGNLIENDGICLSLVFISEVHHNPKHTICIDSFAGGINDNVLDRNRQVREFKQARDSLFAGVDTLTFGREASHILKAVCRELTALSHTPEGSTKHLVLFSNLFENSPFFSVYKNRDLKRLENPKQLARELEGELGIPKRLDGITLEIRYQPTLETEVLHDQMIELYRQVFEVRGCTLITHIEKVTNIN